MREDGVGYAGAASGGAHGDVGKDPHSVHHNTVEAMGVLVEPSPETRRKAEAAKPALAESMNRNRDASKVGGGRRVLTKELGLDAYPKIGACELSDCFGRATIERVQASDYVEDFHTSARGIFQFIGRP